MCVRILHRLATVLLRPARRPADHFGDQVLESGRRHFVMRLVHLGIGVQFRILHDPVDEVIDHRGDGINTAETFVERRQMFHDQLTTIFTSFPGTTITFLIDLPSNRPRIFLSDNTVFSSAAESMSAGTVTRPRSLPLICTGISTVSALSRLSSYVGHGS